MQSRWSKQPLKTYKLCTKNQYFSFIFRYKEYWELLRKMLMSLKLKRCLRDLYIFGSSLVKVKLYQVSLLCYKYNGFKVVRGLLPPPPPSPAPKDPSWIGLKVKKSIKVCLQEVYVKFCRYKRHSDTVDLTFRMTYWPIDILIVYACSVQNCV